jgi:nitroreductase
MEAPAMDFTTVLKTRRSIRAFADRPVLDDVLLRILEAARLAPSACNFQPWRFIVVKDAAARSQLAKFCSGQSWVAKAPVVIVCCGKRYQQRYNWMGENAYLIDLGIAIEHMVLAARNEDLGTCWIGAYQDQPIKKLLGIPADHDVVMLLPIGYPVSEDQFSATTERLAMDQIIHRDRFGSQ